MTPTRLRLATDPDHVARGLVNVLAGMPVAFWRGSAFRVEFCVFRGGSLGDPGNIASVSARVKATQVDGASLMSKTVTELDTVATLQAWKAGTGQHGVIEWDAAETNLPLSGKGVRQLWLVLVATLDDGSVVTLAAGQINCHEPNQDATAPPPGYPDPIILPGPAGEPGNSIPITLVAAEAIGSNGFLHINSSGLAERADALTGKAAHGFTHQAVLQGVTFDAYRVGAYNGFTGLTPGAAYWLGTSGQPTATAPVPPSLICQRLGTAVSPDTLSVDIEPDITL